MLFQLALLGRDVEFLSADFRFVEVSLLSLIQKTGSLGVCIRLPVGLQPPVVGSWASLVGHKLVVGYRGTAISIVAVVWRLGRRLFEQGRIAAHRDDGREHLLGNGARPEYHGAAVLQKHDRRLETYLAFAAVDDRVYASVHILRDVTRGGGRRGAGDVGGRRGDSHPAFFKKQPRDGVRRYPYGDRVKPARHLIRDRVLFRHYHGQRTGTERVGQSVIQIACDCVSLRVLGVRNVDYKRIVGRSALCRVYLFRGSGVFRAAAESVDGLRRERDEPAFFYYVSRARYAAGGRFQMDGFQLFFL